jgi:uncharacterized protein (TIGR00369 family)
VVDRTETFEKWFQGVDPPIARLLGLRLLEYGDGRAVISFVAGPEHANPMGSLHGGIFCDLADAAMGTAAASTLNPGETLTTIELKINFLKPVWTGTQVAEAKVVRRGRTLCYVECDVKDEKGSLVARASSTCMFLTGEKAEGR